MEIDIEKIKIAHSLIEEYYILTGKSFVISIDFLSTHKDPIYYLVVNGARNLYVTIDSLILELKELIGTDNDKCRPYKIHSLAQDEFEG